MLDRWIIDSADLPKSAGQKAAKKRKARQLRGLVEETLELNTKRGNVVPSAQASTCLGYRVSRGGIELSRKMRRRMRQRLRAVSEQGRVRLARSLQSYRALTSFG